MDTLDSKLQAEMLDIKECMRRLGTKRSFTYNLLAHEPGVHRIIRPGFKKPVIRVEPSAIDRIKRRSAVA